MTPANALFSLFSSWTCRQPISLFCTHTQLDMVDHFVDAGKTTTEVMSEIKGVKRMLQPHTNVGGPLVILSTVHKLKVRRWL